MCGVSLLCARPNYLVMIWKHINSDGKVVKKLSADRGIVRRSQFKLSGRAFGKSAKPPRS